MRFKGVSLPSSNFKIFIDHLRGTWLAHLVEHATLDLEIVSSSPTLGTEIALKKKKSKRKEMVRQKMLMNNSTLTAR